MYDAVVLIGLIVASGYLTAGVVVAISLHYHGLSTVDPLMADSSPSLRLLLTPGMALFWPWLLRRRRVPVARIEAVPKSPHPNLQLGAVAFAAILSIVGLGTALLVKQPPKAPSEPGPISLPGPEAYFIQRGPGPVLGRLFPSMPATFQRARNINKKPGLHMVVEEGATVPPTAIYWAPELDHTRAVPEGAILVTTVWGAESCWFPFTEADMWDEGYWIAYSHATRTAETYATRVARERGNP